MFILSVDSKKKKKNTKPQEYLWCISHRKLYPQPQQPASFGVGGTANISVIFQCPLIHLQSDALRSCGQSHPGRTHPVMKESGNGRAISIPSGHIILIDPHIRKVAGATRRWVPRDWNHGWDRPENPRSALKDVWTCVLCHCHPKIHGHPLGIWPCSAIGSLQMQSDKLRWGHVGLEWDLVPMTRVLGRSKNRGTQGDGHVTAEAGVMCLQAKDSWQHQMLGRGT